MYFASEMGEGEVGVEGWFGINRGMNFTNVHKDMGPHLLEGSGGDASCWNKLLISGEIRFPCFKGEWMEQLRGKYEDLIA